MGPRFVAQAGRTDPDLHFWHDRDKDQVDLIVTRGRQTSGVEVESGVTATPADVAGLRQLAEPCGAGYQGGVLSKRATVRSHSEAGVTSRCPSRDSGAW